MRKPNRENIHVIPFVTYTLKIPQFLQPLLDGPAIINYNFIASAAEKKR